ncbi:MAG: PD-(D/E)XK nuclease family protein [Prevotella sp.]|nr:PD-(D/E)XK nuclease family protein [Prevotella sp.]
MKSFLEYVAQDIIRKYGTDLSHTAIVFPNKRASLFLNEYLAREAGGHPLWSPVYITISELFRQQSALTIADPIKLVCDLHLSFCQQTDSEETLDKFYGWGQLLISDFDDLDKNMADADRVFSNLRDIHELDNLNYLTDEQKELLRHFFKHFTEEHETELKQRFLHLWSRFADIYHDFNQRLFQQGLAYEGALYRQVVNDVCDKDTHTFQYDRYLFVGFNLVQKVEQRLFTHLQHKGKAHFYWDFDNYYMQHHEAGRYISQYIKYFPNELEDAAIYCNFIQPKQISCITATTEHIQARYVATWLREQKRYKDGRRTAIVMCDENLLPTVIHSLPSEVSKVNITTGYPLSQTPIASFIQLWFNMQLGNNTPRLKRIFLRHPYARFISEQPLQQLPLTAHLLILLRQIAQNSKDEIEDPLFQESLFRAYTLVNRLNSLVENGDLIVADVTMQRLITQIVQQTSIPFHGEPAEGLQIMGVLETRNLDFDHVLLLSCNEGNMPKGVNDSSFIPHSIRQAYELTTVENKVSIYAYYFYRLLQRAKDITILWNKSTEDGQRGEMSRFMLQMMVESPHIIQQKSLQANRSITQRMPKNIEKTPEMMQTLTYYFSPENAKRLSPTAINRYMRCPHQFYYSYVLGIKEADTPDDEQELDNRIFGNIFHEAVYIIYQQLPQHITKDLLQKLLKNKAVIERAIDQAFHKEFPHAPKSGLHIINREVIIRYVRQLIEIDIRLAPFTILGLECDVEQELTTLSSFKIGGRIDRLDQLADGRIRVIDYKTGSQQQKSMPDVEAIFDPAQIHNHCDYYLQTFVYADIVSRQSNTNNTSKHIPVSPALLFIQHASKEDYDPTLRFGQEKILDIADHSQHFCELLEAKVAEIFSPDVPFRPTTDTKVCRTCPYQLMCRK